MKNFQSFLRNQKKIVLISNAIQDILKQNGLLDINSSPDGEFYWHERFGRPK